MRSDHEIMGTKTRMNYPSGGWCGKRKDCDEKGCKNCFKFNEFVEKKK